ncbi:MAG: GerW family sporulation protein [Candidatus Rifleibacteriota bacterium]
MTRFGYFFVLAIVIALISPAVNAQTPLNETVESALTGIADIFKDNFNSSQTLGKPVEAGDYVIIPVVIKGAGFGFGTKLEGKGVENKKETAGMMENKHEDRIGLGGGAFVRPIALIVVKKGGDFQLIKLNEGFMSSLAKHMAPAICNMMKATVKKLFKMKKNQKKREKAKREEIIIEKKIREAERMGPGPFGRGPMGPRGPIGPGPRGPMAPMGPNHGPAGK